MRKYLYVFKMHFLISFQYRFNTVIGLLFSNIGILVQILFWGLVYDGDMEKTLNGYTLSSIITYYFIGGLFRRFIFDTTYMWTIKVGGFGQILLKPYNLDLFTYFRTLSDKITGMIPQTLFVLAAMPFIARYLTWNLSLTNTIFIILFLCISTITSLMIYAFIGYMAFWFENADSVMWTFFTLLQLATGSFIPLDFFPEWLVPILEKMPWASWGHLPTKIYLGLFGFSELIELLVIHSLWIGILLALNKIIFKLGVKKYSSVGG